MSGRLIVYKGRGFHITDVPDNLDMDDLRKMFFFCEWEHTIADNIGIIIEVQFQSIYELNLQGLHVPGAERW